MEPSLSAMVKAMEAVKNLNKLPRRTLRLRSVQAPPAYGERDVEKVGDETGEVSSGQLSTPAVTSGIS